MPENRDFQLKIVVDGSPIPEYHHGDMRYVESNLTTRVSYQQKIQESMNGEVEQQTVPVTPYVINLAAKIHTKPAYYRVFVDGVKVKGLSLIPGETKSIKGFKDGPVVREFLFSLPRLAKDQDDRLTQDRLTSVGKIEVECWNSKLREDRSGRLCIRRESLMFKQANKKDSSNVTNGDYTMVTSRAGKVIANRQVYRAVDRWHLTTLRSRLCVYYRMGHTLTEMGFTLHPYSNKHTGHSRRLFAGVIVKHPEHHQGTKGSTKVTEVKEEKKSDSLASGSRLSPRIPPEVTDTDSGVNSNGECDGVVMPLAVVLSREQVVTSGDEISNYSYPVGSSLSGKDSSIVSESPREQVATSGDELTSGEMERLAADVLRESTLVTSGGDVDNLVQQKVECDLACQNASEKSIRANAASCKDSSFVLDETTSRLLAHFMPGGNLAEEAIATVTDPKPATEVDKLKEEWVTSSGTSFATEENVIDLTLDED